MSGKQPVIKEPNARFLARIRAVASFNVSELSAEEVVEVYMLLDRFIDALWFEHADLLLPINRFVLQGLGSSDDLESRARRERGHE